LGRALAKIKRECHREKQRCNGDVVNYLKPKVLVRSLEGDDNDPEHPKNRLVWACVPYICLQEYAGDSSETESSFPPQTLMQAGSAASPKTLDLQQAICKLAGGRSCYHIGQLWIAVIDDGRCISVSLACLPFALQEPQTNMQAALLFTYGSMSKLDLLGQTIKITRTTTSSPPTAQPALHSPASIFVSYRGTWLWRIPLEKCGSWFVSFSIS
jgi:hypothetical protein